MAVGLYLLSRMDASTGYWSMALDMLVLGAGIGLCMQVLTIIVQNTVDYRDLGVATSGVTFFRTLGSSFGAAIFGTIYANVSAPRLPGAVAQAQGVNPAAVATPRRCTPIPPRRSRPIVDAYAHALHVVFLAAVPVALVGSCSSLFLKQVPLRDSRAPAPATSASGFGMPDAADSSIQLQNAIARLLRSQRPENSPRYARPPARARHLPTAGVSARYTSVSGSIATPASPRSHNASACPVPCCGPHSPPPARLATLPALRNGSPSPHSAGSSWKSSSPPCMRGLPPSLPTGAQPTTSSSTPRSLAWPDGSSTMTHSRCPCSHPRTPSGKTGASSHERRQRHHPATREPPAAPPAGTAVPSGRPGGPGRQ